MDDTLDSNSTRENGNDYDPTGQPGPETPGKTDNVVEFNPEKNKPHWSGEAQCRCVPHHRWVAVLPCSGNPWLLECPSGCGMSGFLNVEAENNYEARKWAEEMWSSGRGCRVLVPPC